MDDPNTYDVILLPTFTQVEAYRKRLATAGSAGVFSCTITTFSAWIADLWELHGDGRRLVDAVKRQVIMRAACNRVYVEDDLTPGIAPLAARCVRSAAGLKEFEQALDQAMYDEGPENLHESERLLLAAIARYRDMLVGLELVELGQACALLAQQAHEVFPRPVKVLMANAGPLDWMQRQFFEACSQLQLHHDIAPGGEGVGRMPGGICMRFAFPAGRYAQPALVADIIRQQKGRGRVVVACTDPLALYKHLEGALARDGIGICVQARVKFGQTDFGRMVLSLARCVDDEIPFDEAALSDVMRSPFSGISRYEALKLDKQLRADRIASRDAWMQYLCRESDDFSRLDELVRDPEASVVLGAIEHQVMAMPGRSQAWCSEQLAAIGAMRAAMETARLVHLPMDACIETLRSVVVFASYAGLLDDEALANPQVIVTTQAVAATMEPASCDLLLLADLTSDDYPIADRDDACTTVLGKLGLEPTDSALARARRMFFTLQHLPSSDIVFMRPLNDAAADSTYPAVVLEELVDAYRDDPTATDDIDKVFRIPDSLQEGLVQRGEEVLFANACTADASTTQPAAAMVDEPRLDALSPADASRMLPPRWTSSGKLLDRWCPSPSQIECYLECPYRWFAERRLSLKQLDEQFGPLEKGIFMHEVLEAFYRNFQQAGYPKVNADNMPVAREIMQATIAEVVQANYSKQPGPDNGRLVPRDQLEFRELESLEKNLMNYLDFEATLLPTFHPAYLEFWISKDDPVEYAGRKLWGKVDRIDVDDAGHAVIVDYKGTLGPEYNLVGKTPDHVGKVQTRIYAQAVKRALGLDVVGAIYVSYNSKHEVSGAVDMLIDGAHLLGMAVDKCRCGTRSLAEADGVEASELVYADYTFSALLDLTEQRVAEAVANMDRGMVPPGAQDPSSCKYCLVPNCPKRGV